MNALSKTIGAAALVAVTAVGMREIAEARNEVAVGGQVAPLGPERAAAFAGWEHVLAHLRQVGETDLLRRLEALRLDGRVWVAPRMPPGLRAAWVSTLGIVKRVYVAERELTLPPHQLYPGLKVPPLHLETFAWMSLAGTLFHELAHARGITSEKGAYTAEIDWYRTLPNLPFVGKLTPAEREAYEWAVQAAIGNAEKARALEMGRD